jgi:biotin transporter BioY
MIGDAETIRQIVRRETLVSIIINIAISAAFFVALFGMSAPVLVAGTAGLAVDSLPQAFMIGLMASLVPAMLAASRHASQVPRRQILTFALISAFVAMILAGGVLAGLLLLSGMDTMGAPAALGLKCVFGGLLGAIVTPLAVRRALSSRR